MIPLTYFTYGIAGVHFGMWIQRPTLTLIPLIILHLFVWLVWGKGDVSGAAFWLVRPGIYFAGAGVAHFYFVLFGSPISTWKVWTRDGKKKSLLLHTPRQIVQELAQSAIDHYGDGPPINPARNTPVQDTKLWPLHIHVAKPRGQKDGTTFHVIASDRQEPGYCGTTPYLLAFTPGHQVLFELFLLHTAIFIVAIFLWERWSPHATRKPWGAISFGFIYPICTFLIARGTGWGSSPLWTHKVKTRAFWFTWISMAIAMTGAASGFAYMNVLGEYLSGGIIALGAAALTIIVMFKIWCCEAARHAKITCKDGTELMPFFASVSHGRHPVRNVIGTTASIIPATQPESQLV